MSGLIPGLSRPETTVRPGVCESALNRPLSLSLPYTDDMTLRGDVVRAFFDNLLKDSEPIRKRLASHYMLASFDAFDLL